MSHVKVIGVPYHFGVRPETSQAVDSGDAPSAIRMAYEKLLGGYNIPQYFDDLGDLLADRNVESVLRIVEDKVTAVISSGSVPVILGGAHTVSLGALRALSRLGIEYSLVYFDAHPDLMPRHEIDYGSLIYHAIEEGALDPKRIAYVGIRQIEGEEWETIRKHQMFYVPPTAFVTSSVDSISSELRKRVPPPYYVSVDLDCLDPNFAPGVTTPYPFGILPRELLLLSSRICREKLLGFEIVELSPSRDLAYQTTMLAAILLQNLSEVVACPDEHH